MTRARSTFALALAACTLLGACAMELPDPRLVIDTRVLAIRTAVTQPLLADPELDGDRPKAQALPFEVVTIEPFVVGPEGPVEPDAIDPVWLACELSPGQGLFSCVQGAMPIALEDIPECPTPSFMDISGEELPEFPSPCVIDRTGAPEFTVPLTANVFIGGAVELTMIAGVPEGTSTDECADELLSGDYELPNDCIYAVQRLNVGPLEQLLVLADMFGFPIEGVEVPDPEDVPAPDRNPRIAEIRVGFVGEDGEQIGEAETIESGDLVEAPLGATLQVEVDSPEEDLQTFQIPINQGESFEDRDEAYSGDWFRTWGKLLAGTSDDPSSYNQWILEQGDQDEEETPPEGRAWMYYVVRDGRQGVNWFWFELEVTEPAETP